MWPPGTQFVREMGYSSPWLTIASSGFDRHVYYERSTMFMKRYSPVDLWEAATGFDSGDPRWRRKMESAASEATAKNSLCQF